MENKDAYFITFAWMSKMFDKQYAKRDVFAVVYSFSKDGQNTWTGSLDTMSEYTGHATPTCSKCLNELVEEGYLFKVEKRAGNIYYVNLKKVKEFLDTYNNGLNQKLNDSNQKLNQLNQKLNDLSQKLNNNNIYKYNNNSYTKEPKDSNESLEINSGTLEDPIKSIEDPNKLTLENSINTLEDSNRTLEDPILTLEEFLEKNKASKNLKILMEYTNLKYSNKTLADSLINWLELMYANKIVFTLKIYDLKLQDLEKNTKSIDEAISKVKLSTDRVWKSFIFSDNKSKNTFSPRITDDPIIDDNTPVDHYDLNYYEDDDNTPVNHYA